jgi:hypothetical protein
VFVDNIEGTQASLIAVLAFEADAAFPENPQDIEEVFNYISALNYGLERLDTIPRKASIALRLWFRHFLRNTSFLMALPHFKCACLLPLH